MAVPAVQSATATAGGAPGRRRSIGAATCALVHCTSRQASCRLRTGQARGTSRCVRMQRCANVLCTASKSLTLESGACRVPESRKQPAALRNTLTTNCRRRHLRLRGARAADGSQVLPEGVPSLPLRSGASPPCCTHPHRQTDCGTWQGASAAAAVAFRTIACQPVHGQHASCECAAVMNKAGCRPMLTRWRPELHRASRCTGSLNSIRRLKRTVQRADAGRAEARLYKRLKLHGNLIWLEMRNPKSEIRNSCQEAAISLLC